MARSPAAILPRRRKALTLVEELSLRTRRVTQWSSRCTKVRGGWIISANGCKLLVTQSAAKDELANLRKELAT